VIILDAVQLLQLASTRSYCRLDVDSHPPPAARQIDHWQSAPRACYAATRLAPRPPPLLLLLLLALDAG